MQCEKEAQVETGARQLARDVDEAVHSGKGKEILNCKSAGHAKEKNICKISKW